MRLSDVLLPIRGVKLGACAAGIKKNNALDLAIFQLAENTTTAAVFTQNVFCAAPVVIAKSHLNQTSPQYLLINSGNANAGLGENGIKAALSSCEAIATCGKIDARKVLPFSTGVIGEPLPVEKINHVIPELLQTLADDNWQEVMMAIMTTDTKPKGASVSFDLDGENVTMTGIAKGSGMIHPNMATMLAFVGTDINIDAVILQHILNDCVKESFNRISVDGDTSTNDACVIMATGKVAHPKITKADTALYQRVKDAVKMLCQHLAKAIIYDGEGATKFVTVRVNGGKNSDECLAVANTVAGSPLLKTALFASDPNWGRILAAVGRAPVSMLDPNKISIYLGDVLVVENGQRAASYNEALGVAAFKNPEITIKIFLGRGDASDVVWTSDLSYDYVKINAEYRT